MEKDDNEELYRRFLPGSKKSWQDYLGEDAKKSWEEGKEPPRPSSDSPDFPLFSINLGTPLLPYEPTPRFDINGIKEMSEREADREARKILKAQEEEQRRTASLREQERIAREDREVGNAVVGVICIAVALLLGYGAFVGGRAIYREIYQHTTAIGQLEAKVSDVSGLKSRIDSKRTELTQLHDSYGSDMRTLQGEILEISKNNKVSTYSRAIRNQQIKNRLALLQQLFAYREMIGRVKEQLDAGYEEADFLGRKTENDLGIARVFTGDSRDDLIREIDKVISKYSATADMDVSRLTIVEGAQVGKSLEEVWGWVNQK